MKYQKSHYLEIDDIIIHQPSWLFMMGYIYIYNAFDHASSPLPLQRQEILIKS